jgi:hypothetical protein
MIVYAALAARISRDFVADLPLLCGRGLALQQPVRRIAPANPPRSGGESAALRRPIRRFAPAAGKTPC